VEAGLSAKIAKICTQRKFPAIQYGLPWATMNPMGTKLTTMAHYGLPWATMDH